MGHPVFSRFSAWYNLHWRVCCLVATLIGEPRPVPLTSIRSGVHPHLIPVLSEEIDKQRFVRFFIVVFFFPGREWRLVIVVDSVIDNHVHSFSAKTNKYVFSCFLPKSYNERVVYQCGVFRESRPTYVECWERVIRLCPMLSILYIRLPVFFS